ncbi:oxidoreductase [Roseovarius nitratireducens]|uniref:oxidoreductase n=1 Tax=Roseovarius nitratireducens TaxID=2044597 RepID=UPI000CE236EE|nr:FAD-dependent oxidoreductase [Roseovarius nitratireducens]
MACNPRYDVLFEPVKIGPVTARNRFYQVPHCNGMGRGYPSSMAEMRRVKAEGGWAVVCTEEVEIHPSGDHSPWAGGRLWDDHDIPILARMCDGIHEFDSLAGIELNHAGRMSANRYSRQAPLAPSPIPVSAHDPVQARAMDKSDIRALRAWHRAAALRAKRAGFDLVYLYAGHHLSTISHFLSRRHNHRSDEYGGSLENRVRLFREVLEDTIDAVGDTCAVAVRFAVDELLGPKGITRDGEGRDVIEMLAELPDLWDVNISGWENDSATSRFKAEGFQNDYISFVKSVTTKPVVGVGRFTSPDTMVSLVRNGIVDFIGAARPSIADPFLPRKIEEGRPEEIRECIGCNVCVSGDQHFVPIRCTQNPTMGEEWRRGWHPDRIAPKVGDDSVLIVGAGPAGLEAARALGQRGYRVTIADAADRAGGRVARESRLPGLSEWGRVADHRLYTIGQMANVDLFLNSEMTAATIREFGADHAVLATGSVWVNDGRGRANPEGVAGLENAHILTPDDFMSGAEPEGPVVVFDDDHYYMGGLIAEQMRQAGHAVTLVTPANDVSSWTVDTLEQHAIQSRLMKLGVAIVTAHDLAGIGDGAATLTCVYSGQPREVACRTLIPVTMRLPRDQLAQDLRVMDTPPPFTVIGDAWAPGTIAAAVHAGHLFARDFGAPPGDGVPFRRELIELGQWPAT